MPRRPVRVLAALFVVAIGFAIGARLAPGRATAATALRLDVDALVAGSARVFEGHVVAHDVVDDGRAITSEWLVEVERAFRGDDVGVVAVRWPGGVLPDGRGMVVPGMPSLAVGERALFFLCARSGPHAWDMPVGLAQGKWRVRAVADGRRVVERTAAALTLVDDGREVGHAGYVVRDYAEVVAEVHAALARVEARR